MLSYGFIYSDMLSFENASRIAGNGSTTEDKASRTAEIGHYIESSNAYWE